MGTIYINITDDDKLFKQLNYFSPPILLLYFVRSSVNFRLDALFSTSGIGATPLIVVGLLYFAVRIAGKYVGAFLGALVVRKPPKTRNYLGPQVKTGQRDRKGGEGEPSSQTSLD